MVHIPSITGCNTAEAYEYHNYTLAVAYRQF